MSYQGKNRKGKQRWEKVHTQKEKRKEKKKKSEEEEGKA